MLTKFKQVLPFRELELSDREWINNRVSQTNLRGCEYSFGNCFIWRKQYNLTVLDYKGFYLTRTVNDGIMTYSYPAGQGDLKGAVEALIMDSCCHHMPFIMRGISGDDRAALDGIMPDAFNYEEVRGEADYIYLAERLATLAGKKLQPKRNHIARFKDESDWQYEAIDESNIEECKRMSKAWCEKYNHNGDDKGLNKEYCAVKQALKYFGELKFDGGAIRRKGDIVAFTIGEHLNRDTYVVHIEKAYHDMQGAYPIINQEFVQHNCRNYIYVNREEDMGEEGLRKAKMSYGPDILLTKYSATLKESYIYDNLCEFKYDCRTERNNERVLW